MKKARLFALLVQVAIEAILLILLFNTVDKARLNESVFWIAWVFAFVVSLLLSVGLFLLTMKKASEWLVLPPLYFVSFGISFIYIVVGMIFMYLPITDPTWLWVIESILTIIFIVVIVYFLLGASFINKNVKHVKAKVQYIRECKAICDSALNVAIDEASKKALTKLSEDIRYSDPMSNESVAEYEKELFDLILDIDNKLREDEASDVTELVKKASQVLSRRNALVKIRK